MFFQREKELKSLNNSFNRANSAIDFIFASKNVGKTSLVKEYIKDKENIYLTNYEMIPSHFFSQMANIVNKHFNHIDVSSSSFSSFMDILELLNEQNIEKKLVIVFEDFQNIIKVDKNALKDLIQYWKKSLKNKNIQMIVTSSLLFSDSYKNNLERISNEIINLEYLSFRKSKELFPQMNKLEQLYIYSILGTISTNITYYNPKINISSNIKNLFLSKDSYFFDYGIRILKNEISDIGTYSSILHSISKGNTKIGDIASSLELKSTHLTRYLQKLIDMMIIKRTIPLGDNQKVSKFGRYEIKDNTLKFWFSYLYPNFIDLQLGNINKISDLIQEEFINKVLFPSYKIFVKERIKNKQSDIFEYTPIVIDSWWDNNNSIDLIAHDRKTITFVQIIWEDDNSDISYEKLKSASLKFDTSLEKKYMLITKDTFLR